MGVACCCMGHCGDVACVLDSLHVEWILHPKGKLPSLQSATKGREGEAGESQLVSQSVRLLESTAAGRQAAICLLLARVTCHPLHLYSSIL